MMVSSIVPGFINESESESDGMCAQRSAADKRWRSDDGDEVCGKEGKRDSLSRCFRESAGVAPAKK